MFPKSPEYVSVLRSATGYDLCEVRAIVLVKKMPSTRVTKLNQRLFIKIETLRSLTPTKIYNLLREVCVETTLDRSTIFRWSAKKRPSRIGGPQSPHTPPW